MIRPQLYDGVILFRRPRRSHRGAPGHCRARSTRRRLPNRCEAPPATARFPRPACLGRAEAVPDCSAASPGTDRFPRNAGNSRSPARPSLAIPGTIPSRTARAFVGEISRMRSKCSTASAVRPRVNNEYARLLWAGMYWGLILMLSLQMSDCLFELSWLKSLGLTAAQRSSPRLFARALVWAKAHPLATAAALPRCGPDRPEKAPGWNRRRRTPDSWQSYRGTKPRDRETRSCAGTRQRPRRATPPPPRGAACLAHRPAAPHDRAAPAANSTKSEMLA